MSKRTRLVVVLTLWLVAITAFVGLTVRSNREVDDIVGQLRARARVVRVSDAQIVAATRGETTIADSLDVAPHDVTLAQTKRGWCISVHVQRMAAEKRVDFLVADDGALRPRRAC